MDATQKRAWKSILNNGKGDEANSDCDGVEKQQVEPRTAPKDIDESIVTALQELIVDKVKQQVKFALAATS